MQPCKVCYRARVRKHYRDAIDKYRAYERKRFQDPARKAYVLDVQRRRRAKYPGKNKARQWVANAIRDGRIAKLPCAVCGDRKSQAHHDDYRKPQAVRWLCFKHHREVHGQQVE